MRILTHMVMALLLAVFTTGIDLSVHYCEGKVTAVSLTPEHQSCCSDGEVNCCSIVKDQLKIEQQYLVSHQNIQIKDNEPVTIDYYTTGFNGLLFQAITPQLTRIGDPPPPPGVKTLLAGLQSFLL